tara:strand:+ start:1025 stop:1732 length:708 start_codon:yes stop_codon:yes gene_type:complete
MSKIFVDQVDPKTGTSLTLGTSGDTVNIPSGVTLANAGTMTGVPTPTSGIAASAIDSGTIATARLGSGTASSSTFLRGDQTYATAGGTNTPYFHVYLNANQNVTSGATTKVNFNTEVYDSSNAYDNSSNYRYTPQTAGLYKFYMGVTYFADADNFNFNFAKITMNGSGNVIATGDVDMRFARGRRMTGVASCIQQMNGSSDFVEVFAFVQSNGGTSAFVGDTDKSTYFGGYKLIT